jgi:superfamily II RNA helicase
VEDADPENLLKSSFYQYQKEKNAPELERQADEFQKEGMAIAIKEDDSVSEYHSWVQLLERTKNDISGV